jgi:hypothetical protein
MSEAKGEVYRLRAKQLGCSCGGFADEGMRLKHRICLNCGAQSNGIAHLLMKSCGEKKSLIKAIVT